MDFDWKQLAGPLMSVGGTVLGGAIGGPAGAALGPLIGKALGDALGCSAAPDAIGQALQQPGAAEKVAQAQAQIGAAVTVAQDAYLADLADAREQTIELAKQGSAIAWGAPVVSFIGMGGFVVLASIAITHGIPSGDVSTMIVSTFRDIAIYVVSYWLGSSKGSADKTAGLMALVKKK
jgi:hypothetical protein